MCLNYLYLTTYKNFLQTVNKSFQTILINARMVGTNKKIQNLRIVRIFSTPSII